MASDGRSFYASLQLKEREAGLDEDGIILSPLDFHHPDKPRRKWVKKLAIAGITTGVIFILITIAVLAFPLTRHESDPVQETSTFRSGKLEINFQTDLNRVYEKISNRNSPEELERIFDYYSREISDVKTVRDLKDFLTLLRPEGLMRDAYALDEKDVEFACELTKDKQSWYSFLSDVKRNLTGYEAQSSVGGFEVNRDVKDGRKSMEVEELVAEWTKPIEKFVDGTRAVFRRKIIVLSQVMDLVSTSVEFRKPEILIFATDIIYLDTDVVLPETSIALIAPRWSFVKGVSFFLSGFNAPEPVDQGHGAPGMPGGSAGHFLGVGDFEERFLNVYNEGGNGGDGRDGADGADGVSRAPKGYHSPVSFACKTHLKDVVNRYGEVISYFVVFDEFSCGGNGTDGGAPGPGGEGGHILFMNPKDSSARFSTGRRGIPGTGGKGGSGGKGAEKSCFFHAEKSKQGILYPVTNRSCGKPGPPGRDGRDGVIEIPEGRECANLTFFTEALQEYRDYAQSEYVNGNAGVWEFMKELDDAPLFRNLTPTPRDLYEELNRIGKAGKIEFYESLNSRIGKAMELSNSSVLTYLRALSYGKMLNQKRGLDKYVIVDLDVFLEKIQDDIESTDQETLSYKDHTLPILTQLLREKVEYLNENLDRWMDKANQNLGKGRMTRMAQLTLLAIQVLKPLPDKLLDKTTKNYSTDFDDFDYLSEAYSRRFMRHQDLVLKELEAISAGGPDLKSHLKTLKDLMRILNDLVDPDSEISNFPFDIEYFRTTLDVAESVREKETFKKYVSDARRVSDEQLIMKKYLFYILITSQYRDALNVFRQWVFPHMYAYDQFLPKSKNITIEQARTGINLLRKWVKEYKSTITSYDKYIREANFNSNNSVGEYYKWYNSEIRLDLMELFRGRKIQLTADVENFHMFTKNAIKFRTVKLEFQSNDVNLYMALKNVQVEMRHSGYSHYYYNGQIYIQDGEGFDLRYSYETGADGEPVNCNMVYKKLMNGLPIFSPYTTWTIQLRNVPDGMVKLADGVNLALVGSGSYIEATDYLLR